MSRAGSGSFSGGHSSGGHDSGSRASGGHHSGGGYSGRSGGGSDSSGSWDFSFLYVRILMSLVSLCVSGSFRLGQGLVLLLFRRVLWNGCNVYLAGAIRFLAAVVGVMANIVCLYVFLFVIRVVAAGANVLFFGGDFLDLAFGF